MSRIIIFACFVLLCVGCKTTRSVADHKVYTDSVITKIDSVFVRDSISVYEYVDTKVSGDTVIINRTLVKYVGHERDHYSRADTLASVSDTTNIAILSDGSQNRNVDGSDISLVVVLILVGICAIVYLRKGGK